LEVVLAIGLAGAVLALLSTALDLYLVRVDTSRTQVETSQLARTLLNQIASDLRAARYVSPSSSADSATGGSTGNDDGESDDPTLVRGIFGTANELRIDRSAAWQWEYQSILADAASPQRNLGALVSQGVMPQTVRYLLGEGQELPAGELAAYGIAGERLAAGYSGLYREHVSTGAWLADPNASEGRAGVDAEIAEFVAPEVVDLTFEYFDGEQFFDEWDSGLQGGLPQAIEIRLTLLEERFELAATRTSSDRDQLRRSPEDLIEYRLVVSLAHLDEPHEAEFPQPIVADPLPRGP